MKVGGWNTVFLNDIESIREAALKDYDFAGRPKFPSGKISLSDFFLFVHIIYQCIHY